MTDEGENLRSPASTHYVDLVRLDPMTGAPIERIELFILDCLIYHPLRILDFLRSDATLAFNRAMPALREDEALELFSRMAHRGLILLTKAPAATGP